MLGPSRVSAICDNVLSYQTEAIIKSICLGITSTRPNNTNLHQFPCINGLCHAEGKISSDGGFIREDRELSCPAVDIEKNSLFQLIVKPLDYYPIKSSPSFDRVLHSCNISGLKESSPWI